MEERWKSDGRAMEERWKSDGRAMEERWKSRSPSISVFFIHVHLWLNFFFPGF
jgi:hypothetical protein